MMKRLLMLTMVLALVFGFSAGAAAYDDMDGHWANRSVERWTGCQVLYGEGSSFCPDDNLIRGDMALIICRIMGYETMATNEFKDLPADAYYTKAVLKANYAGVIFGDGDGTVRPEDNITREEAAAMFSRALLIPNGTDCNFKDAEQISGWAKGAVCALAERKALRGYSDGTVRPLGYITRAEAATLLDNLITVYQNTSSTINQNGAGFAVLNAEEVTLSDMTFTGEVVATDKVQKLTLDNAIITESLTVISFGTAKTGSALSSTTKATVGFVLDLTKATLNDVTFEGSGLIKADIGSDTRIENMLIGTNKKTNTINKNTNTIKFTLTEFLNVIAEIKELAAVHNIKINKLTCNAANSTVTFSENIKVDTLLINATAKNGKIELGGGVENITGNAEGATFDIGEFLNLSKLKAVNLGENATDNQLTCGNMAVELNAGVEYGNIVPITNTDAIPEVINGAAIVISDGEITGQNVQLNLDDADNSAIAIGFKPTDYDQGLILNSTGDVKNTKLNLKFNVSVLEFKEGNFCSVDLSGNNNKINLETVNDSDVESYVSSNLTFIGNDNTLTLIGGNNRVTVTGNNTTVNANNTAVSGSTGRNTLNLTGDNGIVNSVNSTDNMEVNISGNGARVTTGSGNDTVSVTGNGSAIYTNAGADFIAIQGDKTTSVSSFVQCGDGDDLLISNIGGTVFAYAGEGADCIYNEGSKAYLYGQSGNNLLIARNGDGSYLFGGNDNDVLCSDGNTAKSFLNRNGGNNNLFIKSTAMDDFTNTLNIGNYSDIVLESGTSAAGDPLEKIGWGAAAKEGSITKTILDSVINKAGGDSRYESAVDYITFLLTGK